MSNYYLLNKPNRYKQYRETRRNGRKPTGLIVVHTAENQPVHHGPDPGAENVAKWIRDSRTDPGSYHRISDADSRIAMAPWEYEVWGCRFTNNWAYHVSGATRAGDWAKLPGERRLAILRNMAKDAADAVRYHKAVHGKDVPVQWRTREEAMAGKPGFIRHGDTDPTRRSDPWPSDSNEATLFLDLVREELGQAATTKPRPIVPDKKLKSTEEIAREVIAGKWGNNPQRATRLAAAGYNASTVQRVVNELLAGKGTAAKTPATPPGLRRGSTGTGVGRLQRGLNRVFPAYRNTVTVRRGHLLVLDEVYGPTVEAWVQEFQRRTRLPVTGVVDAATERKLATFGIKL